MAWSTPDGLHTYASCSHPFAATFSSPNGGRARGTEDIQGRYWSAVVASISLGRIAGGKPTSENTMMTIDDASLKVKAWQFVMLVNIVGWLILCVVNYALIIRSGHQSRRIMQREIGQDAAIDTSINSSIDGINRGPIYAPPAVKTEHRPHNSESSTQADPRAVSPPRLTSRSASGPPVLSLKETNTLGGKTWDAASAKDRRRDDAGATPSIGISLQLEKDEVLQDSPVMARSITTRSFGDLTSGNDGAVVKAGEFIGRELWRLEEYSVYPNTIDTLGFIKTSRRVLLMMPLMVRNIHAMIEVEPLTECVAPALIRQLVFALEFMHLQRIVHRDISSPAFWFQPVLRGGHFDDVLGTESYMAPEMLEESENAPIYDFLVDKWATGVVTNEMLTRT